MDPFTGNMMIIFIYKMFYHIVPIMVNITLMADAEIGMRKL